MENGKVIKEKFIPETFLECPRGHKLRKRTKYLQRIGFLPQRKGLMYGCEECAIEDGKPKTWYAYHAYEWKIIRQDEPK